jgi:flagellin
MRINHNIAALNTYRQLGQANDAMSNSMEKLSSGLRINKAGDDAAGLAISEKMRGQIRGLDQAQKNAQDGISLIQTAEGSMNESHSILQRMRELAVQSSNDTNTDTDRKELQKEVDQLAKELTRIGNSTEFNTQKLNNGGFEGTFQIGANEDQNLTLSINAMDASSLGLAEDVASVSANLSNATDISGVDIDGAATFTEGKYTISTTAPTSGAASTFNVQLKDDTGTVIAELEDQAAGAAGDEITFTTDNGDISVTQSGVLTANTAGDINISASGADLTEVAADNTAGLTAVQMDDEALAAGDYEVSYTTADGFSLKDSEGNELATDGTAAADGGKIDFTVDGKTISITQGTAAGDGTSAKFTVTQSDYTSGSSYAADKDGDGTIDGDAVAVKGIDISTQENANTAITKIQNAIETVSSERSKLGAVQNRLDHTINNLGTSAENLTAAESRIRDVDMAKEMMNQTKNSILAQAAQAMLAQSNQIPQGVLQLLR